MSGIAGLLDLDGADVSPSALQLLSEAVARRGPDGSGSWMSGSVGFAYRAFPTTPESTRERQPLVDRARGLALVADARVDNRRDLCEALGVDRATTDADLVLAAYGRWGDACAERLVGDFAFAVWDERRRTLFCARDPFGVRSFFYHASPRFFAFASDADALFTLDCVSDRFDRDAIADHLAARPGEASATLRAAVRRLPPAHTLTIANGHVRIRPYWTPDPARELRLGAEAEYVEAFRETFAEAVRCRMRSTTPVGVTLSGGLDSSSVTAMARRIASDAEADTPHAFSWRFDGLPQCDERAFADAVLAGGNLVAHDVLGGAVTPLGDVDGMLRDHAGPCLVQNIFLWRETYRVARDAGLRVMLDGHDGDSIVSHGTEWLEELARRGRWLRFAREARFVAKRLGRQPAPFVARRAKQQALAMARGGGSVEARAEHYKKLTSPFLRYATEALDATGAGARIEPRHPFLDRRLVELCLALPAEQKLWRGWGRAVLRRALDGILVDEVRWRVGKTPLGAQFDRSFRVDLALVADVIERDPGPLADFADVDDLKRSYREYVSGAGKRAGVTIWSAVTLGLWLRRAAARDGSDLREAASR